MFCCTSTPPHARKVAILVSRGMFAWLASLWLVKLPGLSKVLSWYSYSWSVFCFWKDRALRPFQITFLYLLRRSRNAPVFHFYFHSLWHMFFSWLCALFVPGSNLPVHSRQYSGITSAFWGFRFVGEMKSQPRDFWRVVHFGYTQAIHQTALLNKGELCVWNCIGTVLLLGLCGPCFPLASSCTICMYQRGAAAWFSMIFCLVQSIRGRFHQLRAEWLIRLCHSSFPKLLLAKATQRKSEKDGFIQSALDKTRRYHPISAKKAEICGVALWLDFDLWCVDCEIVKFWSLKLSFQPSWQCIHSED